jgi:hypothetical protein
MIVRRKVTSDLEDSRLLLPGHDYVAYGVLGGTRSNILVFEQNSFSFPFFVSDAAVDIIDAQVSKYWIYSPRLERTEKYSSQEMIFSFADFVLDRYFYQNLVDGDADAVAIWKRAKELMDLEAQQRMTSIGRESE